VRKRDHLESIVGRLKDNIKMYLEEKWGMGWVWLSTGKDGGFL